MVALVRFRRIHQGGFLPGARFLVALPSHLPLPGVSYTAVAASTIPSPKIEHSAVTLKSVATQIGQKNISQQWPSQSSMNPLLSLPAFTPGIPGTPHRVPSHSSKPRSSELPLPPQSFRSDRACSKSSIKVRSNTSPFPSRSVPLTVKDNPDIAASKAVVRLLLRLHGNRISLNLKFHSWVHLHDRSFGNMILFHGNVILSLPLFRIWNLNCRPTVPSTNTLRARLNTKAKKK